MAKKGNHKRKDVSDLTPKGVKRLAGASLTKLIKQIGNEEHTIDDEGRVLSKFEALARLVWDKALGFRERIVETGEEIIHKPDKAFISLIFDRTEGRVTTAAMGGEKKKLTLADRVGEEAKSRLNRLAKND